MATTSLYPLSSEEELKNRYVGKTLKSIPTPAAILDLNKLKNNCERMLETSEKLDFGFRVHIKTHKTTELTRLQVGPKGPVKIIVSTIIEAENVAPLLLKYKEEGRSVNLLYSFPIVNSESTVERLSTLSKSLGPHGLSLMVDHPAQLSAMQAIHKHSGIVPDIFLKIDMGARRAGVIPGSTACTNMIESLLSLHSSEKIHFHGLYAYAGHSYDSSSQAIALDFLRQEFDALITVASSIRSHSNSGVLSPESPLVLSVGTTPTTTSMRNLLVPDTEIPADQAVHIAALKERTQTIRELGAHLEFHAGVYPVLDVQQLSTHALPTSGPHKMLTWSSLALTILAEITSFYPTRGPNSSPEALIGAGSIALGREPCKSYPGSGIVSPWGRDGEFPDVEPEEYEGWYVKKVSQEHGVLGWRGEWKGGEGDELSDGEKEGLKIGGRVRIWPNHACIAGAGFGWYFIVDSSREGKEDEIVDIWVRWRGW